MIMFSPIFVTLLLVGPYQTHCQNCHMRELDICVATLVFSREYGVPETERELDIQCSFILEAQNCLLNYTKSCMMSTQSELLDLVGEGSNSLISQYCSSDTQIRERYLNKSACLSEALDQLTPCWKDLEAGLDKFGEISFDLRPSTFCCTYQRFFECVRKTIEDQCGVSGVEFILELLRIGFSRIPEVICSGSKYISKQCVDLLPPPGTEPKGSRSKSVLSRLLFYIKNT
ncbi:uncharacterized protein LOC106464232 isoform X1 [Limulus polyphemus]|uniref:Uncharacterized protein LOC106464232 isoform X1 n=2 Tax=Limulus polyphemus TaxID=6850 RepID=A0ABM1BDK0_LIMPO|nr:uncharacterized protein LOC106464232 isoform X1 [Limulus polyphemus]